MEHRTIKRLAGNCIAILIPMMVLMAGCYYDNEAELYPGCDVSNVTYSSTIKQIIDAHCYSCHNNGNVSGGINLEGYTNVANAAQIPEGTPGSLYGAINWAAGNSPMPKNQNQLDDCTIKKVKAWIDAGTPNN